MTRDEVMTRLSELLARCEFIAEASAGQLEQERVSGGDKAKPPRSQGPTLLDHWLRHLEIDVERIERDLNRLRPNPKDLTEQQRDYYVLLREGERAESVAEASGLTVAVVNQIRTRHGREQREGKPLKP